MRPDPTSTPRTLKLTLAYDGSAYAGWQLQPHLPTLQGALEKVLTRITGEEIRTVASGRTDSGVHALGQVVSFQTASRLPPEKFRNALNAWLPRDMSARSVEEASPGFHAIYDATGKRYRYVFHDGPLADIFRRAYAWHYPTRLDVEAMQRAAAPLTGRHDFQSFQTAGSSRQSTVRTVREFTVRRLPGAEQDTIHLEVEADGFLYNMVRALAGTLLEVGRGTKPEAWPLEVLKARDRRAAGPTSPPQGLFLVEVRYDLPI